MYRYRRRRPYRRLGYRRRVRYPRKPYRRYPRYRRRRLGRYRLVRRLNPRRPETKIYNSSQLTSYMVQGWYGTKVFNIAQGVDNFQRIGNIICLLNVDFRITVSTGGDPQERTINIHLALVKNTRPILDGLPDENDIWRNANSTPNPVRNTDYIAQYKVHNYTCNIHTVNMTRKVIRWYIPLNTRVKYADSGSNVMHNQFSIWYGAWGQDTDYEPTITWSYRLRYMDA